MTFTKLIEKFNIPVALTWAAVDLLPSSHPLRIGTFGTHGSRFANFSVQNSDFILSIGSRLDTKATGGPHSTFERSVWKAVNDISADELNKFDDYGLSIDLKIHSEAAKLVNSLLACNPRVSCKQWLSTIDRWKQSYAICNEYRDTGNFVDPYLFCSKLSELIPKTAHIWSDTGSIQAWLMQSFEPRGEQRVWHDFNNTAMGWALPAAIAAKLALPANESFCMVGDGSLMMNI